MPKTTKTSRQLSIRPDSIDIRDRPYNPTLQRLPSEFNHEPHKAKDFSVKDQGKTSACTGFALSSLVERLLVPVKRLEGVEATANLGLISPYMLYHFAVRYDEFPGEEDNGSSARAAMKAWHKHGAASVSKWPKIEEPNYEKKPDASLGWIDDAFKRPLGAYYRVDPTSIPDIHAALIETGVLYATASIHTGWDQMNSKKVEISLDREPIVTGGHAFVIVGYDEHGLWIQNSWGTAWGISGYARLSYADWSRHGWDLWVAQAGVQISGFVGAIAGGVAPDKPGERTLSSNDSIRAQQLNPYIINLSNDGFLSDKGKFRTTKDDLDLLVEHYIPKLAKDYKLGSDDPIDVAIYAHGGLTTEEGAEATAVKWIPALQAAKIVPLFMMWETGAGQTFSDILEDALFPRKPIAAGNWLGDRWRDVGKQATEWLDDRLESGLSAPGTLFWDQMKQNANAASMNKTGGLMLLYKAFASRPDLFKRLRLHLIGHSAGACFHAALVDAFRSEKTNPRIDGIYFMAPALRLDVFEKSILPQCKSGDIPCYTQFHLTDRAELNDVCVLPNTSIGYKKSLLYLVSNSFERKRGTALIGMEKFSPLWPKKPAKSAVWDWIPASTGKKGDMASEGTSHGGFGLEAVTMKSIVARISKRASCPIV